MNVSKEFLLEAFGLSLLVALILISVQMFQRATQFTELLEQEQEKRITELEEYEVVKFDGLMIDGMTAIGYIKRVTGNYELPVKITSLQGTFIVEGKEDYASLRDMDSRHYINPLAKYKCEVLRDENGTISEVTLVIETEGEE